MPFTVVRLVGPMDESPTKKSAPYTMGASVTYHWRIPNISMRRLTLLRLELAKLSASGKAEEEVISDEMVDGKEAKVITITLKERVLRAALTTVNKAVDTATTTTSGS